MQLSTICVASSYFDALSTAVCLTNNYCLQNKFYLLAYSSFVETAISGSKESKLKLFYFSHVSPSFFQKQFRPRSRNASIPVIWLLFTCLAIWCEHLSKTSHMELVEFSDVGDTASSTRSQLNNSQCQRANRLIEQWQLYVNADWSARYGANRSPSRLQRHF